jgi:uncharacterized membrane protein YphA (DoxX/SURF4 family)
MSREQSPKKKRPMRGVFGIHPGWGLTPVCLSMGLIFAKNGYQKFMSGIAGVASYFAKMGVPLPDLMGQSSQLWNLSTAYC